ncbi:hypothetical protein A1O3_05518 [Capronia epimyces CBS 606.96]|uniref:DUF4185 domain-containing protein n=1 Tax=Capronia epimyces CBS 606.96 TaxID=1182542 RepID=W9YRG2_9EURO|nr:uncharacterized protein A1O3_05518 [Capronia epimyces CBS 606.96]EXJ84844.1 hypothetical protein A1O3_05518 [Capronia epimyces CBS 606.96]
MDSDKHAAQHAQGFGKRIHRWAGGKINRLLDLDATNSSASDPAEGTSTESESDHFRVRFKTPALGDASADASKPYPPTIDVENVEFLGQVHSATTYVKRDLGFQGRLGEHILLSYGDTMYSDAEYSDKWRGMVSDSVALATHDPLVVVDPALNHDGYPEQFCPLDASRGEDASEYSLGITNVVSTVEADTDLNTDRDNTGVMFFLLNHRPGGINHILGAGIATVSLDTSTYPPAPQIQRHPPPQGHHHHQQHQFWWDGEREPWYGDICALRWDEHIYAYGHGGEGNPWVYVARVPAANATQLDRYEYWNGDEWQAERLQKDSIGEKESVFWQINQGQVVYSKWFGCFIFVYCDNFMNSRVHVKTAQHPQGPWSDPPVMVYQAKPLLPGEENGCIYAAVPHPYFDESGKTLVVTFTNHPNTIQAVKVVFA